MKKNIIRVFLIFIITILVTGCSSNLKRISYNDFKEMLNNKENFILIVSQEGCSHCEEYSPRIKKILKENSITAYNLNITYISKSDYNKFKEEYNFKGTPTTFFFKNGAESITSRLTGSVSDTKIKKALKKEGFID